MNGEKSYGEKLHHFMEHFVKFGEPVQKLKEDVYRLHGNSVSYCNSFLREESKVECNDDYPCYVYIVYVLKCIYIRIHIHTTDV